MLFPREQWKDVVGYEGLYQVSSVGRVRSLNYNKTGQTKILKPRRDKDGYLRIELHKYGIAKSYYVHRLVAQAFIPNPENKPQIDHINTIKTDNYYKNLRWATPKENSNNELTRQHCLGRTCSEETKKKMSEARKGKYCGEKHPMFGRHQSEETRRKKSKQVEILKDGVSLGIFYGVTELSKRSEELFGIKLNGRRISDVCLGKYKHHKGFTFRYVNK